MVGNVILPNVGWRRIPQTWTSDLKHIICHTCPSLVRGTPTAGVLIHWVIISRRWERIQQCDSESPINTDSPSKKKCCDAVA